MTAYEAYYWMIFSQWDTSLGCFVIRSRITLPLWDGGKSTGGWSWRHGFAGRFADRTSQSKPWESTTRSLAWQYSLERGMLIMDFGRSTSKPWPTKHPEKGDYCRTESGKRWHGFGLVSYVWCFLMSSHLHYLHQYPFFAQNYGVEKQEFRAIPITIHCRLNVLRSSTYLATELRVHIWKDILQFYIHLNPVFPLTRSIVRR